MFVAVKKQTNPTDSGAFYLDFTYKHAHPNGFKTHAELSNNFRTERFNFEYAALLDDKRCNPF